MKQKLKLTLLIVLVGTAPYLCAQNKICKSPDTPPECNELIEKIRKNKKSADIATFKTLCKSCPEGLAIIAKIEGEEIMAKEKELFTEKISSCGCSCQSLSTQIAEAEKQKFSEIFNKFISDCGKAVEVSINGEIAAQSFDSALAILAVHSCFFDVSVLHNTEATIRLLRIERSIVQKLYTEALNDISAVKGLEVNNPQVNARIFYFEQKCLFRLRDTVVSGISLVYTKRANHEKGFWISREPVNLRQFQNIMRLGDEAIKENKPMGIEWNDNMPVVNVQKDAAVLFCSKLGKNCRLPTIEEWKSGLLFMNDTIKGPDNFIENRFTGFSKAGLVWEMVNDLTGNKDIAVIIGGAALDSGFTLRESYLIAPRHDTGFRILLEEK